MLVDQLEPPIYDAALSLRRVPESDHRGGGNIPFLFQCVTRYKHSSRRACRFWSAGNSTHDPKYPSHLRPSQCRICLFESRRVCVPPRPYRNYRRHADPLSFI